MSDLTKPEGILFLSLTWGVIIFALIVSHIYFETKFQGVYYFICISSGIFFSVVYLNQMFGFIKWDEIGQDQWK